MKICLVGKFPPIAGGVSTRTYAYAHALARCGHDVHVVTNANEVGPPHRMLMREEDWGRCAAKYGRGAVRVHWTEPFDRRQLHIPAASPFVTKLASLGIEVVRSQGADVVFSFYAEPYAVAGHLIAEAMGLPHVVRTAGSDSGRLWRHPQFKPLYDHVFRSTTLILAGGTVADAMEEIGIARERLRPVSAYRVDEETFSPDGPALDVQGVLEAAREDPSFAPLCWGKYCSDLRYFGVYGKLGERKGTAALLRALATLIGEGTDVGLLVMGHRQLHATEDYRALAASLGLAGHIVQIPFLPNWRVPGFIRRCLAVCCLEQNFPIAFHAPIIAREVMACGTCLVASTEILRKVPFADKLVHGYNCVAVNDVDDVGELAGKLAGIVERPELAPEVGARARRLVVEYQRDLPFPQVLEDLLAEAVTLGRSPAGIVSERLAPTESPSWPLASQDTAPKDVSHGPEALDLQEDPLFRLTSGAWALASEEIDDAVPRPMTEIQVMSTQSGHDLSSAGSAAALNRAPPDVATMVVDELTIAIIGLCDGKHSIGEIAETVLADAALDDGPRHAVVERILELFEIGILRLCGVGGISR